MPVMILKIWVFLWSFFKINPLKNNIIYLKDRLEYKIYGYIYLNKISKFNVVYLNMSSNENFIFDIYNYKKYEWCKYRLSFIWEQPLTCSTWWKICSNKTVIQILE